MMHITWYLAEQAKEKGRIQQCVKSWGGFFSILRKVAVLITMFSSELTVDRPNTFH